MPDLQKIREALHIFGLEKVPRNRFSELESHLKKRYHLLAQKVHPDHSKYQADLFIRLHGHFELLKQAIESSPGLVRNLLPENNSSLPYDASGSEFLQYRDLVMRLNTAIEKYFVAMEQSSQTQQFHNNYQQLATELALIRPELAALASRNPQAVWIEDVRKNLRKIDIWLKENQSTAS